MVKNLPVFITLKTLKLPPQKDTQSPGKCFKRFLRNLPLLQIYVFHFGLSHICFIFIIIRVFDFFQKQSRWGNRTDPKDRVTSEREKSLRRKLLSSSIVTSTKTDSLKPEISLETKLRLSSPNHQSAE